MTRTIAVFGGSFNPPGIHHRHIATLLAQHHDEVVVVPCGPRPDKPVTNDVPPIYRASMVDMTFRGLPGVQVDLFDLESRSFTRTHLLDEQYSDQGEVWHVIGADMLTGGARGDRDVSMMMRPDGIGSWTNPGKFSYGFYAPGRLNDEELALPNVVLNEILADPPMGIEGDTNGDGVRHSYEDEFVEIVNIGSEAADLSLWCITDDDTSLSLFRFPEGTVLSAGERAVIFGGGEPTGIPGKVFTSSGRISNGLANARDRAMLTTPDFRAVDELRWPKNPIYGDRNCSIMRAPDGSGAWRLPLGEEPAFSPNASNVSGTSIVFVSLNEVLADPAPGLAGDANGDGTRNSVEDEFVELVNYGDDGADVSGWWIEDLSGSSFTIPNGTVIPAGEMLTIFGGGTPTGIPGEVVIVGGAIGNGLGNSRDGVILFDRNGEEVDWMLWPDGDLAGDLNVSMIRVPDAIGDWESSLPPHTRFSPGASNGE